MYYSLQNLFFNTLMGKPELKPKKIDFITISQVNIFSNQYKKTTLYLKNIHKKQTF